MLLALRSRRPCSEPGRTRIQSSPTLRSDLTRGGAATHRWTGAWRARPGTCDQPGSAGGTTVLRTKRNPEAAVGRRDVQDCWITHCKDDSCSLAQPSPSWRSFAVEAQRERWNGSRAAAEVWQRSMLEAHHFLKVDQFLQVVWVSLIDERHVLEETTERTSVRLNLKPTWTLLGHLCHL